MYSMEWQDKPKKEGKKKKGKGNKAP